MSSEMRYRNPFCASIDTSGRWQQIKGASDKLANIHLDRHAWSYPANISWADRHWRCARQCGGAKVKKAFPKLPSTWKASAIYIPSKFKTRNWNPDFDSDLLVNLENTLPGARPGGWGFPKYSFAWELLSALPGSLVWGYVGSGEQNSHQFIPSMHI